MHNRHNLEVFKEGLRIALDSKKIELATPYEISYMTDDMARQIAIHLQFRIAGNKLGKIEWKVPASWWEHTKMAFYRSRVGVWLHRNSWIVFKLKNKFPVKNFTYSFDIKSYYPLIPINGNRPEIIIDHIDAKYDWQIDHGAIASNVTTMDYKEYLICPRCKGTGYLVSIYPDPSRTDDNCEMCEGLGSILRAEYREPYEIDNTYTRKDTK